MVTTMNEIEGACIVETHSHSCPANAPKTHKVPPASFLALHPSGLAPRAPDLILSSESRAESPIAFTPRPKWQDHSLPVTTRALI